MKKQIRKKATKTKQRQIIKRKFSKTRNAVSESDATTFQDFQNLRDLIYEKKTNQLTAKIIFPNPNPQHH